MSNEFAQASGKALFLRKEAIPVRRETRGLCELLGLDPLNLANEGMVVAVVPPHGADTALATLRAHPHGRGAARIGEVSEGPVGQVVLEPPYGGRRLLPPPPGELLPRIC